MRGGAEERMRGGRVMRRLCDQQRLTVRESVEDTGLWSEISRLALE